MSHNLSSLAANLTVVPRNLVRELLREAPEDSIVLIDDEVHRKFRDGEWRNLEIIAPGDYRYNDTWETMSLDALDYLGNEHCSYDVQLVRWGA